MKAQIMAIGNVTPDSFYAASRLANADQVVSWAQAAVADGADILDIGGCSTRPGSTPVDTEEEWQRVEPALTALKKAMPDIPLSVDTPAPPKNTILSDSVIHCCNVSCAVICNLLLR